MKKIKIGFLNVPDHNWMGGVNYLKNLLYAIQFNNDTRLEPYVFVSNKYPGNIKKEYQKNANVIVSSTLDRKGLFHYASLIIKRIFNSFSPVKRVLAKSGIQVLSHFSNQQKLANVKQIGWIPDFQHLHLPQLFTDAEREKRDINYRKRIANSDIMIFSSKDAYEDFKQFAPEFIHKGRVLNFVSQPDLSIFTMPEDYTDEVMKKYSIQEKYFFLPNQFWKHKNHLNVFKAVEILKKKGVEVQLICSGNMDAPMTSENAEFLKDYIRKAGLDSQINLLGLINFKELMLLARNSISVINPSKFEGWSSTVEECKSMGKNMILSNIAVHLEQSPPGSLYVDPDDPEEIAQALQKNWEELSPGPDIILEENAKEHLKSRTIKFAEQYEKIVEEVLSL